MGHSEEEQGKEHHACHHVASGAAGQLGEQDQAQAQQEVVGSLEPTGHEDVQDLWEEVGQGMEVQDLPHEA